MGKYKHNKCLFSQRKVTPPLFSFPLFPGKSILVKLKGLERTGVFSNRFLCVFFEEVHVWGDLFYSTEQFCDFLMRKVLSSNPSFVDLFNLSSCVSTVVPFSVELCVNEKSSK